MFTVSYMLSAMKHKIFVVSGHTHFVITACPPKTNILSLTVTAKCALCLQHHSHCHPDPGKVGNTVPVPSHLLYSHIPGGWLVVI